MAAEAALFVFLAGLGMRLGQRGTKFAPLGVGATAAGLSVSATAVVLGLVSSSGFFAVPIWALFGAILAVTAARAADAFAYSTAVVLGASLVAAGRVMSSWGLHGLAATQAVLGPAPLIRGGRWSIGLLGVGVAALLLWSVSLPLPSSLRSDFWVAAGEIAVAAAAVGLMAGPGLLGFAEGDSLGIRHSLISLGTGAVLSLLCGFLRAFTYSQRSVVPELDPAPAEDSA